jgi:gliding motility-associated-like protein
VDGCVVTGVYTIAKCDFIIYLPNTITPGNADGLNDGFGILEQHQLLIQDFDIYIYSRWGVLVYHSNDKNFRWYGEFNGYTYHNNMYSYVIFCTDRENQKHVIKGSVLVM